MEIEGISPEKREEWAGGVEVAGDGKAAEVEMAKESVGEVEQNILQKSA